MIDWLRSTRRLVLQVVGIRRFLVIVGVRGVFEGVVRVWVWQAWPYWLKDHQGLSARRRSLLTLMAVSPWGFRSLATVALAPLRRWRYGRAAYLTIAQLAMVAGAATMGRSRAADLAPEVAAACVWTFELSRMSHVVVQDGMVNELIRANPSDAAAITATFVALKSAFALAFLPVVGFVLSEYHVSRSYSPCLVALSLVVLLLVPANLDDEVGCRPANYSALGKEVVVRDELVLRRLAIAGTFCAAGSVLTAAFPVMKLDPRWALSAAAIAACGGSVLSSWVVGSTVALVNFYVVAARMFAVDVTAARFCFFTDAPEIFPDGPHLSRFFVTTVLASAANAATVVAVLLYERCFSQWSHRAYFRLTALLALVGQAAALPVLLRWFSGLVDAGAVLAEESLNLVLEHVNEVPWYMLIAANSAPGTDFHVMGLCGACRHLADPVQLYGGVLLLAVFDVNPDGTTPTDASQLARYWKVHVLRAALAFLPTFFGVDCMIPPPAIKSDTKPT